MLISSSSLGCLVAFTMTLYVVAWTSWRSYFLGSGIFIFHLDMEVLCRLSCRVLRRLDPWLLCRRRIWRRRRYCWSHDDRRWGDLCCLACVLMSDGGRCWCLQCLDNWWWCRFLRRRLSACRGRSGRRRRSSNSCGLARPLTSRGSRLPPAFGPFLDESWSWLVLMKG